MKEIEALDQHEATCKECKTRGYCSKYHKLWEKLIKAETQEIEENKDGFS